MPGKPFKRIIVWFRRDLRVEDNQALSDACRDSDEVIPLFVLDDAILSRSDTGASRVVFLLDALAVLNSTMERLGGRLVVRRGTNPSAILDVLAETRAEAIYFNRDYEPYARVRDDAVTAGVQRAGRLVKSFKDQVAHEPGEILSRAGTYHSVFSPYKREWFLRAVESPAPRPDRIHVPADTARQPIPTPADVGIACDQTFECGGEGAANVLLEEFIQSKLERYGENRNNLAADATSRLSRHFHFGTIGVRKVIRSVTGLPGAEPFISELTWRDFYTQILYHCPHVETGAFRQRMNTIEWHDNAVGLESWKRGETGYPIVDAAMRQMNQEAWMHNRGRMIVASFLCKDLLLNWQVGERYFMQKLVDGDLAQNNGGWQWAAGTGTDAQPYFRIFNPSTQGQKFDPAGLYVKQYVPELRNVPDAHIHEPWTMPESIQRYVRCVIGKDYPAPIVNHAESRKVALEMYARAGARPPMDSEGAQ